MMWKAVVMCAALGAGLASGQTWLSNITDHFREGTSNVMRMSEVNYSKPVINVTYVARVELDMRAMGHLYNSTHTIIDFIANKQAYPEGFVSVSDGYVELASPRAEWRALLAHYAGPLAVVLLVALFAAVLPLSGLFWCCCQWCRVGRRRRPFDRKYDACLKGILAIVFIGLLTLFLFGVVCAFATDSQMETGAGAAPDAVRAAVRDARAFLDSSAAHARHLLVDNYRELEAQLDRSLEAGGGLVLRQLDEFTNATSVRRLGHVASTLERVPEELRRVQAATAALRAGADSLDEGLRRVKAALLNTLARCQEPQCVTLQEKYKIGQLYTDIQYDKIPDVSELLDNVSRLVDADMLRDVRAGLQVFAGIRRTVDQHAPRVRDAVAATGERLARVADEVTWAAGNLSERLRASRAPDVLQDEIRRYAPYVRHPTRAVAAALLAIVVLMSWGLVCGVCGKRPDVYGASDCCNKGAGASCITCGMALTFAACGVAALAMLVYFVFGLAAQRLVCDPLVEPRGSRVFADVERFVELERALYHERNDPDFNLTSVLVDCHANRTVYRALRLRRTFDLAGVRTRVAADVAARVSALRTDYPPRGRPLRILAPAARARLDRLAASGLSDFDFDRIPGALETNVTSLSLEALGAQLRSTALALRPRAGFRTVAAELGAAADDVDALQRDVVAPMLERTRQLNKTASELRDALRFNESSLREAILSCVRDTNEVELFLNTQGPDLVQNLTREFAETLGERLQQYLSMVAAAAEQDVGRCGPLSNAFNVTRDAACRAFVLPANGYWVSLAWCALLAPALLAAGAHLTRLYRRAEPYPGPLVEAEYLYDAYADRDNVPLANGSKRSTLDVEGKIAEWRGRGRAAQEGGENGVGGGATRTQVVLEGREVVCQLIDDLKTRLDVKDEDNESGIHDADAYKEKRGGGGAAGGGSGAAGGAGGGAAGGGGARRRDADGAGASHALAPPLDAHHARRYNDMAPKHWEEGPPRYHGPTEYERPPPYYYPGPHDRQ